MVKKNIPHGYQKRDLVKISSSQFKGTLIGLVSHACKYDEGVVVWIPKGENEAQYWCIDPDRVGDSIQKIKKEDDDSITSSTEGG